MATERDKQAMGRKEPVPAAACRLLLTAPHRGSVRSRRRKWGAIRVRAAWPEGRGLVMNKYEASTEEGREYMCSMARS